MKIQLAYKFIGEDSEEVRTKISEIISHLETLGHVVYCPLFDSENPPTEEEMMPHTFKKMHDQQALVALVLSNKRSEGMLMEIGHAIALGKKVIVIIQKDFLDTRLRHVADQIIEFNNPDEIKYKLKELK